MFYIDLDREYPTRYGFEKFCSLENDTYDILTSYFIDRMKDLPMVGIYKVSGEERRPDLVSYEIYEDTQYWWILMNYNNLIFVDDISEGTEIGYPSIDDLEDIYFSLNRVAKGVGK